MKHVVIAALMLGLAGSASAHEYWLEAPRHDVAVGGEIGVGIFVGSDLTGQQLPYFPQQYRSLEHFAPGAEGEFVRGRLGAMPALALTDLEEGLHVIALETRDSRLTWDDAAKFESFLEAEGLQPILTEHRERGLPPVGFAESYSRSAKALIGVGSAQGDDLTLGLPVELVALDNPFTTVGDITLRFDVAGAPKGDAQINLFHRSPEGTLTETALRTDDNGIATAPDMGPGFYLANAVQMDAVRDAGPIVWHSSWASLTWTER